MLGARTHRSSASTEMPAGGADVVMVACARLTKAGAGDVGEAS